MDKNRLIRVHGPISELEEEANKLLKLSEESKKPIYILIDSFGGSVLDGVRLIQAIDRARSRKVPVICAVEGAAMSMATHIVSSCTVRYALPTSLIMWHPMAISTFFITLTKSNTERINKQLKLLSDYLDKRLRKRLGISEEKYREYEEGEYIVFASDLDKRIAPKFLRIINDIQYQK